MFGALAAITGRALGAPEQSATCAGVATPSVASYDPNEFGASAQRATADGWIPDPEIVPAAWRSGTQTLVLCVDHETEEVIEECTGGARRYAYPRVIRFVETRTAREIGRTIATASEAAGPCPDPEGPADGPPIHRLSGARIQDVDLQTALRIVAESGPPRAP